MRSARYLRDDFGDCDSVSNTKTSCLRLHRRDIKPMYNKNTQKDWWTAAITAALGAGVITTLAVSQGQSPLTGLAITGVATAAALAIDHYL